MGSLEVPDERGGIIMVTNLSLPNVNLPVAVPTSIEYVNDFTTVAKNQYPIASHRRDSGVQTCLFNPGWCEVGLSLSFWLQSKYRFNGICF